MAASEKIGESALVQFLKLWNDAEARIKRTERLTSKLTVPAVNELRYAGYHLLQSVTGSADPERAEQLAKAAKHCLRSGYDAVEAEVLMLLEAIKLFQEDYRAIVIEVDGFDYVAVRTKSKAAMRTITSAREIDETRDQYYEKIVVQCDELILIVDSLDGARDELNKRIADREKDRLKQQRDARRWKLTTAIAIIAAIGGWAKIVFDRGARADQVPPAQLTKPP